jgi:GT2 family glycosyltransferase
MAGTDWSLEVAGDGPQRASLQARARRLGISDRVRFAGHVGDRLPEFYRRLDVVAIPSLPTRNWVEQFGRVAVEAMASGVPVVASHSGALPDVVAGAGLLVSPGDPGALRAAITQVADPACWAELRAAGLTRSGRYTWQAVATAQLGLYRSALAVAPREPVPDSSTLPPQVIVVAYGPSTPLQPTLSALDGRLPVTIVDNSSLSETRELARRHSAHYIDAGGNVGFAKGVNLALRSLRERQLDNADVLLLNPDATISAGGVLALQRALHASPTHACVAPAQRNPDTGAPERVVWPFPSPAAAWLTAVGGGRLDRRRGFAIGSILLLRQAALRDVGDLDDRFFLYAEETDWQRRATRRGWTVGFIPEVEGSHVGAGTGGSAVRRFQLFHGSLLRYMLKHHGPLGQLSFRAAMILGGLVRSVLGRGDSRQAAWRRVRLYLDRATVRDNL